MGQKIENKQIKGNIKEIKKIIVLVATRLLYRNFFSKTTEDCIIIPVEFKVCIKVVQQ